MAKLSEQVEVANSEEPHCATVLLLDTSGSMDGSKIQQLNEGLGFFKDDICGTDEKPGDDLARKRIDLAIVTFSSHAQVVQDFTSMDAFQPPELVADGTTAMGEGIRKAAEIIERRKAEYRARGIDHFRPWLLLITDGEPTDIKPGESEWDSIVRLVHDGESQKKFIFFPIGVEPANLDLLRKLSPPNRPPVMMRRGMFNNLFSWLSNSLGSNGVSGSRVGDQVKLEDPTAGKNAWCDISA